MLLFFNIQVFFFMIYWNTNTPATKNKNISGSIFSWKCFKWRICLTTITKHTHKSTKECIIIFFECIQNNGCTLYCTIKVTSTSADIIMGGNVCVITENYSWKNKKRLLLNRFSCHCKITQTGTKTIDCKNDNAINGSKSFEVIICLIQLSKLMNGPT